MTRIILVFFMTLYLSSCKKYLDTKSIQSFSTPSNLKDLEALLNHPNFYRYGPALTQTSSDEYYIPFTNWQSLVAVRKLGHVWDPNLDDLIDWQNQYLNILYANTVLDALPNISGDRKKGDEIRGAALFHRAHSFFHIAQLYALQYDPLTAQNDLGIVLRTDANFNKPSRRASVQASYDQIVNDLNEAVAILPEVSISKIHPNKAAGYALLARTYLQIGDYVKAKDAADKCLQYYSQLIDYNDISEISSNDLSNPIVNKGINHKEIIFYQYDESSLIAFSTVARIDTTLYRSYDINDIRKQAFFRPITIGFTTSDPADKKIYRFKGSYSPNGAFVGLSTPEIYLIRAECNARLGSTAAALQDLNILLVKRYKTGTFVPVAASTSDQALQIILKERKKEMLFRGIRWADLRRLNKNLSTAITLKRDLNGQIYTLPPNDLRYTLLIPKNVIDLSNLEQNPR